MLMNENYISEDKKKYFVTFYISDALYGLEMLSVQELLKPIPITKVQLAPKFISGLMNIRGQVVTAIDTSCLLEISNKQINEKMNIICSNHEHSISFLVDEIVDIISLSTQDSIDCPQNISENIKPFIREVYRLPKDLLRILDLNNMLESINTNKLEL